MADQSELTTNAEQQRSVMRKQSQTHQPGTEAHLPIRQDGLGHLLQRAADSDAEKSNATQPLPNDTPTSLQRQQAKILGDARLRSTMYVQRRAELLLQLQQTYGNTHARHVARLINEQHQHAPALQRHGSAGVAHAAEEEAPLQRRASETLDVAGEIQQTKGSGQALDSAARTKLEPAMGVDLGHVSIHADSQADTLSRSVQAEAFTTGNDIYFRSGRYDPHSDSGLHLLSHEITHTVQQSKGAVSGTQHAAGVSVSDPSDSFEREAEQNASQTMARVQRSVGVPRSTLEIVQREEKKDEDEEHVQTKRATGSSTVLQRHPQGAGLSVDAGTVNAEIQNPPPLTGTPLSPATGPGGTGTATGPTPAPSGGPSGTGPTPAPTPAPTPTPGPSGTGPTPAPVPATNPTPAPAPTAPESMSLVRAQEVLTASYGSVHKIVQGSIVLLDGRPALWAKYDEINKGRHNPNTNAPWVDGDAQRYIPGLEGFADAPTVYVNSHSVLPTVTAHEMLHTNTASDFRGTVGETINEGTTERLALKALTAAGVPTAGTGGAQAYPNQRNLVESLVGLIGEDTLIQAYFNGASLLVDTFERMQGKGTWAPLKTAMEALNTTVVNTLLTPPSTPQRIAAINALLDWWVSDHDLDVIEAICKAPGTDMAAVRTAIQPRITSLTSIGQRTRLRLILGTV